MPGTNEVPPETERSGWKGSIPVSRTPTLTPAPVVRGQTLSAWTIRTLAGTSTSAPEGCLVKSRSFICPVAIIPKSSTTEAIPLSRLRRLASASERGIEQTPSGPRRVTWLPSPAATVSNRSRTSFLANPRVRATCERLTPGRRKVTKWSFNVGSFQTHLPPTSQIPWAWPRNLQTPSLEARDFPATMTSRRPPGGNPGALRPCPGRHPGFPDRWLYS